MEVPEGHRNKVFVCLYEALGTCVLLMAVNCGAVSGNDFVGYQSLVVAITLLGVIIIFGPITGGHFNPAVTLGVFIKEGPAKFRQNGVFAILIMTS